MTSPGRTGVPIRYETILRAAKHPNIVAVKDAKGDLMEVSRVLNETDLMYFAGDDGNALPTLAIGGVGMISVTANIAPRALPDHGRRGEPRQPARSHRGTQAARAAGARHDDPRAGKRSRPNTILHGLGHITSPRVRLPLVGPEDDQAAVIEADIDEVSGVPGVDFSQLPP